MASIYESVVSILKQPVTPKGTTVRDTLVESNGLARPTKGVEDIDEAARYHAGQHVTGKYRSGIGHYTIDHVVKGTEDSSDPEYVVTQHDNHVSASGKKEPKQLKHRQSDLHATNEDRLDELSPQLLKRYIKKAKEDHFRHSDAADEYGVEAQHQDRPSEAREYRDAAKAELAKARKRLAGVHIARYHMANEDRLDELSPQLLKRYIKKAKEDHFQHSDAADEYGFEAQHQDRPSEVREYRNAAKAELAKAHKRLAGVHIARYHMANEDRLDELSPELKRRYAKAAAADLADTAEKHAASSYVSSDFDDIIDNRLRGLKRLGAGKEARRLEKASYYVGSADDGYDAQDRAREKLLRKFDESILESVEFNALIESTAEVLSEAASRNDYVAVAKILHDAGSAGDDQFESPAHAAGYRRAIKHLGAELADHFKRTNSAFSHDRFRKAAGLDDVER